MIAEVPKKVDRQNIWPRTAIVAILSSTRAFMLSAIRWNVGLRWVRGVTLCDKSDFDALCILDSCRVSWAVSFVENPPFWAGLVGFLAARSGPG